MSEKIVMPVPAIIVVGFNRPHSLARLLASLARAKYDGGTSVPLIISIDKADNKNVECISSQFKWPFGEKRVILQPERLGLRNHILSCGDLTEEFESVIVLEDDLYVSPLFYRFAQQTLAQYATDDRIAGISLYTHLWNVNCSRPFAAQDDGTDVFFMQFAQSWGQVWNKRMWKEFRLWYDEHMCWDCRSDDIPERVFNWPQTSWLKYQTSYIIKQNKYFVYPRTSFTTNFGDVGQHAAVSTSAFQVPLLSGDKRTFDLPAFDSEVVSYDAFFERIGLGEIFEIQEKDICVDLYGTKDNRLKCRYWLTMERLGYKILASFQLAMRPHEVNVVEQIPGKDIFLYDTSFHEASGYDVSPKLLSVTKGCYDAKATPRRTVWLMAYDHFMSAVKRKFIRILKR